MYIVTETVGQTKVDTPVATAYDGFLHLAQTVPNYRYNRVEGDRPTFEQTPLLWFLAINQESQTLRLTRASERIVVQGEMDELGHFCVALTKEYPVVGKPKRSKPKRIVNTLTWRDDYVLA
jgi:hypothetical protein